MRVVYNTLETNVKVVQNSNVQVLFEIMQNLRIWQFLGQKFYNLKLKLMWILEIVFRWL